MTQSDPDLPDPPDLIASTDPAPASAALPAPRWRSYGWAQARADYLAGEPGLNVAARLGVTVRTLSRHARDEGWRRCDVESSMVVETALDPVVGAGRPLDLLRQASDAEDEDLIEQPDPRRSIRYAFHRANEAARLRRPAEAVTWLRLIDLIERQKSAIGFACNLPSDADSLRAMRDDVRLARQWAQVEEWNSSLDDQDDDAFDADDG